MLACTKSMMGKLCPFLPPGPPSSCAPLAPVCARTELGRKDRQSECLASWCNELCGCEAICPGHTMRTSRDASEQSPWMPPLPKPHLEPASASPAVLLLLLYCLDHYHLCCCQCKSLRNSDSICQKMLLLLLPPLVSLSQDSTQQSLAELVVPSPPTSSCPY